MDKNSILVLDDECDIVTVIKTALENQKYSVFCFTESPIALEHFRNNYTYYGLVITDLRMPVMNGFDFIKSVRQIKSEIKVLLMSAFEINDDPDFADTFKTHNINGFLHKPFSIKELNLAVKDQMQK
jgi:DNA-binding NtrC family response regulator